MNRRSIRGFLETEIANEEIYKILDSARYAASPANSQPWRFFILTNKKLKLDFKELIIGHFRPQYQPCQASSASGCALV